MNRELAAIRLPRYLLPALALAVGLTVGCGGSDDDDDVSIDPDTGLPTEPPKVKGKSWRGFFYRSDETERHPIRATITQEANAITLITDRDNPPVKNFAGTISNTGEVRLTDQDDGELWSSYFGPATGKSFKIADFIEGPEFGDDPSEFPLFIIELSR